MIAVFNVSPLHCKPLILTKRQTIEYKYFNAYKNHSFRKHLPLYDTALIKLTLIWNSEDSVVFLYTK